MCLCARDRTSSPLTASHTFLQKSTRELLTVTSHWVCVCVCQCNMCECRGCFIQETKSEDTYMQKTHSKLSVQNCFLCDIHVIEQVRASSYKSVRMTGTSIYWLITDSWKIRTFSGTKDLAVVSLNCPCFAGTKG